MDHATSSCVLMIVGNDIRNDSRVLKTALALSDAGLQVTVLGLSSSGMRRETHLGDVRIFRVPVAWRLRDGQKRRRQARRALLPTLAVDAQEQRLVDIRATLRARESAELGGTARRLRAKGATARRQVARVRGRLDRPLRRYHGQLWSLLDNAVDRATVGASWRRLLPEIDDYELAFAPVIDRLEWDVLHAHGVHMVGIASHAVARRSASGRKALWVYDAHEFVAGLPVDGSQTRRRVSAYEDLEREYVRDAGAVVTVTEPMARELQRRYRLGRRPVVVMDWAADGTGQEHEAKLRGLYRVLLGEASVREPTRRSTLTELAERPATRSERPSVVGIGPANMAGQGWAWAKAMERHVPGVRTEVMTVDRGSPLTFRTDALILADRYSKDRRWSQSYEAHAVEHWTHALLEAGRPLFGLRHGRDFTGDTEVLRAVGVQVGLLFHGSEVRNPARHTEETPWSPFRDSHEELTARLQRGCATLQPLVDAFEGPKFVSTPDLLRHVPGAVWLPVVVDLEEWAPTGPVLEREVPVVVHTPSRASLKGSAYLEDAMAPLVAEGLVDYRRIEGVPPDQLPGILRDADVVLDQFTLGIYGVLAAQAMAAGRVVVGHVTESFRADCGGDVPILEATPDTVTEVVRRVVEDRGWASEQAARGPGHVRELHDGRRSARVLVEHLDLRGSHDAEVAHRDGRARPT